MLTFLIANAATIIVGLAVAAIVALIVRGIYRDKKAGKSSCGGGCASCPSCSICHGQKK